MRAKRYYIGVIGIMSVWAGGLRALVPEQNFEKLPITLNVTINNQSDAKAHLYDQRKESVVVDDHSALSAYSDLHDISLQQKISNELAALPDLLSLLAEKTQQGAHDGATGMMVWCKNHKIKTILFSIAGSYVTVSCLLKYAEHKLSSPHWWSTWRSHQSLIELYAMADTQMVADLLSAIQARYTVLSELDDFNTPLALFFKALKEELAWLHFYKKLISCLERLTIDRWFFINATLRKQITQRIERLTYLKAKVWNWISHHKVDMYV